MNARASARRMLGGRAVRTWPLFSTMTKKDCLIMETRIPKFLITYNYFSAEHLKKDRQRERNPRNIKEKLSGESFLVFTGTCARASDATSRFGQFRDSRGRKIVIGLRYDR